MNQCEELKVLAGKYEFTLARCEKVIEICQAQLPTADPRKKEMLLAAIERASVVKAMTEVRLVRLNAAIVACDAGTPPPPTAIESAIFQPGGTYSWLPDAYDIPGVFKGSIHDGLTLKDLFTVLPINSDKSNEIYNLQVDGGKYLCNDFEASWGEHGPKWLYRHYNVTGAVKNLLAWRVGDFTSGREGHVLYLNPQGDILIENLVGIQHGAQLVQLVWRAHETLLPQSMWPSANPNSKITLRNLVSVDGGVINLGMAVRASWPISIFNPGHKFLTIDGLKIRCNHPVPFIHSSKGLCHSHGAILTGGDTVPYQGQAASLSNLDIICADPDREMIRAWGWDEFIIHSGLIQATDHYGNATPWNNVIDVASSVKHFEIKPEVNFTGKVCVFDKTTPYSANKLATYEHVAGQHLVIDATKFIK